MSSYALKGELSSYSWMKRVLLSLSPPSSLLACIASKVLKWGKFHDYLDSLIDIIALLSALMRVVFSCFMLL